MRILLSIVSLCLCVFFSNKAGADYFHHNTDLMKKIKPNLTVRSKPTSNFIKLASVQFLGGVKKELNYGCPSGHGWNATQNGCEVNPCDGYPYISGSRELDMCAIGADGKPDVGSCLSGTSQRFKCNNCKLPLVPDGLGGCMCNRSEYKVEATDVCGGNKTFVNPENSCTDIQDGVETTYYEGCDCPRDWVECAGSLVGEGEACSPSVGNDRYKSCKCNESYVECTGVRQTKVEPSCTDSSGTKYSACYTCMPEEGYIGDLNNYWCGNYEWTDIRPISATYSPK